MQRRTIMTGLMGRGGVQTRRCVEDEGTQILGRAAATIRSFRFNSIAKRFNVKRAPLVLDGRDRARTCRGRLPSGRPRRVEDPFVTAGNLAPRLSGQAHVSRGERRGRRALLPRISILREPIGRVREARGWVTSLCARPVEAGCLARQQ